ncbi:unnamed protein product [Linum trigynum]|uniref:Uncharacterized protein n=1 Tax=Linum trigynum TaxID=586398 RepID=A0AAV2DX95_9ROSI
MRRKGRGCYLAAAAEEDGGREMAVTGVGGRREGCDGGRRRTRRLRREGEMVAVATGGKDDDGGDGRGRRQRRRQREGETESS